MNSEEKKDPKKDGLNRVLASLALIGMAILIPLFFLLNQENTSPQSIAQKNQENAEKFAKNLFFSKIVYSDTVICFGNLESSPGSIKFWVPCEEIPEEERVFIIKKERSENDSTNR